VELGHPRDRRELIEVQRLLIVAVDVVAGAP
jgi:hypothetical protein